MFLFIGALRALPLVDAMTLVYVGPLIVTALAPAMLGERVGRHRWAAVLVGFAGVVLMLRPGGEVCTGPRPFPSPPPFSARYATSSPGA